MSATRNPSRVRDVSARLIGSSSKKCWLLFGQDQDMAICSYPPAPDCDRQDSNPDRFPGSFSGGTVTTTARVIEGAVLVAAKLHSDRKTDLRDVLAVAEVINLEAVRPHLRRGEKGALREQPEGGLEILREQNSTVWQHTGRAAKLVAELVSNTPIPIAEQEYPGRNARNWRHDVTPKINVRRQGQVLRPP